MDREYLSRQIGQSIRRIRLEKDLSQESLALSAGMHPAYFGRLERGERCPTIDTLYKISTALNVPIFDLLEITDENHPEQSNAIQRIASVLDRLPPDKQNYVADMVESIVNLVK